METTDWAEATQARAEQMRPYLLEMSLWNLGRFLELYGRLDRGVVTVKDSFRAEPKKGLNTVGLFRPLVINSSRNLFWGLSRRGVWLLIHALKASGRFREIEIKRSHPAELISLRDPPGSDAIWLELAHEAYQWRAGIEARLRQGGVFNKPQQQKYLRSAKELLALFARQRETMAN